MSARVSEWASSTRLMGLGACFRDGYIEGAIYIGWCCEAFRRTLDAAMTTVKRENCHIKAAKKTRVSLMFTLQYLITKNVGMSWELWRAPRAR